MYRSLIEIFIFTRKFDTMKTMTKLLVVCLFSLFIGITACRQCQTCEYDWEYTEDDTLYSALEISDESCGNTFKKLPDSESKFRAKRSDLETLLNKDPDKKDILVSPVTCIQTAY